MSKSDTSLLKYCFSFKEMIHDLITPAGIKSFDGMRAVAMIWIIVHHCYALTIAVSYGDATEAEKTALLDNVSVFKHWILGAQYLLDLFFVISGFLIAAILFREWKKRGSISTQLFYYRRFMRLMPIYFFVLFITFIVMWIANLPGKKYLLSNVFYINNFFQFDKNPLPWTWSMAVEEQFYLLLPAFLLLTKLKKFIPWMLGLFVLSFIIRFWIIVADPLLSETPLYMHLVDKALNVNFKSVLYDNLYTRYGSFICGITLAYVCIFYLEKARAFIQETNMGRIISWLSIITLFLLLFVIDLYKSYIDLSYEARVFYLTAHRNIFSLAAAVFGFLLIINAPCVKWINKALSMRFWYPLGQLAYSAYLIHFVIVAAVAYALNNLFGWTLENSLYLIGTVVISGVLTYLISFFCF